MEVTSVILAGGKNMRLGRNKALEVIRGKALIERVYDVLVPLSSEIIVVTSRAQTDIPIDDRTAVIADIYPEKGPLGGIYTGLTASKTDANILVACDMPFLNVELLGYMLDVSEGYDAVIPRLENDMIEPLHAVYSKNCISVIDRQIADGKLSIHAFLERINVRYVEQAESEIIDPEHVSFFNINYQSDLDRAIRMAEELDS
jgi:molybdopterin-guanine dinucleotide biosynthesis protein A